MYSFCAMYSFRMSVWIVPRSSDRADALLLTDTQVEGEEDRRRRVDRHRRRHLTQRNAANSVRMSSSESTATPSRPTSPSDAD